MERVLIQILNVYVIILFTRAVLSWFPSDEGAMYHIRKVLLALTEPVLRPVRRVLPSVGGAGFSIDLSLLVVTFGLQVIGRPLIMSLF